MLLTAARTGGSVPGSAATMALRTAVKTASGPSPAAAATAGAQLRARIKTQDPHLVPAVGVAANVLAAQLPGRHGVPVYVGQVRNYPGHGIFRV